MFIRIPFFIYLCLWGLSLSAQSLDSLLQIGPAGRDSIWMKSIISQSFREVYKGPAFTSHALKEALDYAKGPVLGKFKPNLLVNLGIAADVQNQSDSAFYYNRRAMAAAREIKDTLVYASALNNIGLVHWNHEVLDSALIYFQQSEALFTRIRFKKGLASCLNNIGLIYQQQNRYQEAMPYFRRTLSLAREVESKYFEVSAYANMADNWAFTGQMDSALAAFNLAIDLEVASENYYGLARLYHSRATFYIQAKHYEKASKDLHRAMRINQIIGNEHMLASNQSVMAFVQQKLGHFDSAYHYLDQASLLKKDLNDFGLTTKIKRQLISLKVRRLDTLIYQELSQMLKQVDSLQELKLSEKVLELQTQYETEKKERQLRLQALELENARRKSRSERQLALSLGLFTLVLAASGFGWYRYRKKLSDLAYQQALQKEKTRISRDLHDHVGSQLTSIQMRMSMVFHEVPQATGKTKAEMDHLQEEARQTVDMLRDTIWAINQEQFSLEDLSLRLQNYAKRSLPSNLEFSISCDGHKDLMLNSLVALNLFRMAQEAFQNIQKHAKATQVHVKLKEQAGRVTLNISDNGIGSDLSLENNERPHYGLQNIQDRAKEIQAKVQFISRPGNGFAVEVQLRPK